MNTAPHQLNPATSTFHRFTRPAVEIATQIVALFCVLAVALRIRGATAVLPGALGADVSLDATDTNRIYLYFLSIHLLAYLISRAFQRKSVLSSAKRALVETYFVMAANGVAISALFLFTPVPFTPNLYALVYLALAAVYVVLIVAAGLLAPSGDRRALVDGLATIRSRWTPAAVLLAIAPGILVAANMNGDMENLFNWLRVRANVETSGDWVLVQAFPELTFEQPIYLQPDPRNTEAFVLLSRTGRLRAFAAGENTLLLDLWPEVQSLDAELGAFSFALHPEYGRHVSPRRGFVYLWYSARTDSGLELRLTRFDVSLPTLDARQASRLPLIALKRSPSGMHNGGTVLFGSDGFLYLSIGDLFDHRNGQGADKTLAAGVLRIDVDRRGAPTSTPIKHTPQGSFTGNYFIPTSNPWHGRRGILEEFWAIGFRNPFRMSIDAEGRLWVGDVGWHAWEEHNVVSKGDNGGWPFREGPEATIYSPPEKILGRLIEPVYAYPHTSVAAAALGGFVYSGGRYPELHGMYIFADNTDGSVMAIDPDDAGSGYEKDVHVLARANQFGEMGLTGIYVMSDGRILVTSLGSKLRPNGEILELIPATGARAHPVPSAVSSTGDPYVSLCSRCHGIDGRGHPELDTAPAPASKPRPDFTSASWQASVSDERIMNTIVGGGTALGLSEEMPAFGAFFSEDELDGLVEKIRAFGRSAPTQNR